MKFVESFSKEDFVLKSNEDIFNKFGETPSNEKEKIFAKYTKIELGSGDIQKKYYILTYKNIPYDPTGIDSHRESSLETKLKSVSQNTFDNYVLYLKTRNPLYMTKAQRSFING
ncbi:hypothetical protein EBZ38_04735 [bacterium]|nr:hypothetical protein [bacterium]